MWTKVAYSNDSLPPIGQDVLCFDHATRRRFVGHFDWPFDGTTRRRMWCDSKNTFVAVTHWAPLPDDPED